MTEATPHAQLRAHALELADLRQRIQDLTRAVHELQETIDELTEAARRIPPPIHPTDLTEPDRDRQATDVDWWLTHVLAVYHPHVHAALRPCWRDHPHIRQHVTDSWLAWVGAYRARGRRHTDPDDYLTKRLPGLLGTLTDTWGRRPGQPCPTHHGPRDAGT